MRDGKQTNTTPDIRLPPALPMLSTRVTLRLLAESTLPRFKGALLRGSFGYAFQRATCPQSCWGRSDVCEEPVLCPYRWVFETPHPPDIPFLHHLRDVPRPFVIEPPLENRTHYAAGDPLEFTLVLFGRGLDYLPYFLFAFEQVGHLGLGRQRTPARLERIEALDVLQPTGTVIYQDGHVQSQADTPDLPTWTADDISDAASCLPTDIRVRFVTPLRIKTQGQWLQHIDLPVLVQALSWRINALSVFHGGGPWNVDHHALVTQAQTVEITQEQVHWVDWGRTSGRGGKARHMILGGMVGSVVLRGVPPNIRTMLLAGSLVHIGKACVFGHGGIRLEKARTENKEENQ